MPWSTKAEAIRLGPWIPTSDFWASAKEGIDRDAHSFPRAENPEEGGLCEPSDQAALSITPDPRGSST